MLERERERDCWFGWILLFSMFGQCYKHLPGYMAGLLYGGPGISPIGKSILMMATIAAWELVGGSLLLGMVGGNVMYYLSWMQWAFRDRFDLIEGYMYPTLCCSGEMEVN